MGFGFVIRIVFSVGVYGVARHGSLFLPWAKRLILSETRLPWETTIRRQKSPAGQTSSSQKVAVCRPFQDTVVLNDLLQFSVSTTLLHYEVQLLQAPCFAREKLPYRTEYEAKVLFVERGFIPWIATVDCEDRGDDDLDGC